MIVEQYKPVEPDCANELHRLTLMRMQAREDADKAYSKLHTKIKSFFEPEPRKKGVFANIIDNLPVIMSGIKTGRKIIDAVVLKRRGC